jgi:hypothetical protein
VDVGSVPQAVASTGGCAVTQSSFRGVAPTEETTLCGLVFMCRGHTILSDAPAERLFFATLQTLMTRPPEFTWKAIFGPNFLPSSRRAGSGSGGGVGGRAMRLGEGCKCTEGAHERELQVGGQDGDGR